MSCFEAKNFFKVYLPKHSFQRMSIPPNAVVCSNELISIPATATLRNRKGQCWPVAVNKCDDRMYFEKGWRRFIDDNYVKEGYLLVFSYVGCSLFDVKVCVSDEGGFGKELGHKEEEEEDDDDDDDDDEDYDYQEEGEDIELVMDDDNNDDDYGYQEEGKDTELMDDDNNDDDYGYQEEGEDIELVMDDDNNDDDYGYQEEGEESELEMAEMEDNEEEPDTLKDRRGQSKTNKRNIGQHELLAASMKIEDMVLDPQRYVHELNPYFLVRRRQGRKNELFVPTDVIKDYDVILEDEQEITFLDQYGRKKTGHVRIWKDGRTCITGWRSFCNVNRVDEKRDVCICEFLLEDGQKPKSVKVHIIRGKLEKSWKP